MERRSPGLWGALRVHAAGGLVGGHAGDLRGADAALSRQPVACDTPWGPSTHCQEALDNVLRWRMPCRPCFVKQRVRTAHSGRIHSPQPIRGRVNIRGMYLSARVVRCACSTSGRACNASPDASSVRSSCSAAPAEEVVAFPQHPTGLPHTRHRWLCNTCVCTTTPRMWATLGWPATGRTLKKGAVDTSRSTLTVT